MTATGIGPVFHRMVTVQASSPTSKDIRRRSYGAFPSPVRIDDGPGTRWHHFTRYCSLHPLAAFGFLILFSSMTFIMFPQIDISVSRFFALGTQFPLSENPALLFIRDANRMLPYIVLIPMLILLTVTPFRCSTRLLSKRARFVVISYVLGPTIVVHTFKTFFARARPRSLTEFGGTMDFTPAWQFASMCERNCSFPSGEAASAAAFLAVVVFVPKAYRDYAAAVIIPLSIMVSLNRVIFGAHFLSDVVLAWLMVCWIMLWLYRKMGLHSLA
jgi:membrane-associated PAP2 superfamily phosphatase